MITNNLENLATGYIVSWLDCQKELTEHIEYFLAGKPTKEKLTLFVKTLVLNDFNSSLGNNALNDRLARLSLRKVDWGQVASEFSQKEE